jgi:hypothetical protein
LREVSSIAPILGGTLAADRTVCNHLNEYKVAQTSFTQAINSFDYSCAFSVFRQTRAHCGIVIGNGRRRRYCSTARPLFY